MIMSDGSLVNLQNVARCIMEAGLRKVQEIPDSDRKRSYLLAVRTSAMSIKAGQKVPEERIEALLALIYHGQEHKATMRSMRKILQEIGNDELQSEYGTV